MPMPEIDRAKPGSSWPETVEIVARHASRCLESVTAQKASKLVLGRTLANGDASLLTAKS